MHVSVSEVKPLLNLFSFIVNVIFLYSWSHQTLESLHGRQCFANYQCEFHMKGHVSTTSRLWMDSLKPLKPQDSCKKGMHLFVINGRKNAQSLYGETLSLKKRKP